MSQLAKFANTLAPIIKQAAETAGNEKKQLQENLGKLEEQRKALEADIRDIQDQLANIDEEVQAAIMHCLREEGFKPARSVDGTQAPRRVKKTGVSEAVLTQVIAKIGQGRQNAKTSGQLAKEAGVEGTTARKAIKQLLADEKIRSEGQRRAKKYFR